MYDKLKNIYPIFYWTCPKTKTSLSLDYMIKNKFKVVNETKQQILLSKN